MHCSVFKETSRKMITQKQQQQQTQKKYIYKERERNDEHICSILLFEFIILNLCTC